MESVKKSIDERAHHKRDGTESVEQDTSSKSGNDVHADDVNIIPIYDEEPMAEEREYAIVKPHHVIASSESRNSSKNMPRFSSNDMVHNHYLEEAKKKTQGSEVNSRAKVTSNKTMNINKPIEQLSVAMKPERQIPKGHSSELRIQDHNNEPLSSKLVPKVVPPADKTATSQQEL
uniref:Uncharacterized protein n=1 Tax=Tanacetum cinerariifolium TaxID=118510 RepID=A0A699I7D8_TANCI|nr:hypothetical protein [Tanacetum cinerariifolium]